MSPDWDKIDKQAGQVNERDSSNGARNFPGIFCKFCEPLEKARASFSEKKISSRIAYWSAFFEGVDVPRRAGLRK